MKTIKLQIVALVMLLGFTTVAVAPRPAHAIIGICVGAYALRTAGGVTMLLGGAGAGAVIGYSAYMGIGLTAAVTTGILISTVTAGIGLLLLDGQPGALTFQVVDLAKKDLYEPAGVTAAQVAIYNTEIDELNAVRESIDAEMVRIDGSMEDAKVLWESYRSHFTADTITVAAKLTGQMFAKMAK